MFVINPRFNLRRSTKPVQKKRKDKAMEASKWNNVANEIQQSIHELLTKHGINYPN